MDTPDIGADEQTGEGDEVERLRRALDEERQRGLRLLADFDTLRRRVAIPSDALPPGTVADEVRRGWRLGDDLLRPAQVVVVAAAEDDAKWP